MTEARPEGTATREPESPATGEPESPAAPAGVPPTRPGAGGPKAGRFNGIQALRFVAALLVVITHSTYYTHERLNPEVTVWDAGTAGVDIFFVISGFVIVIASRRLIGRPGGARQFSARRLIRIVPVYWVATTINLAVLLVAPGEVLHSSLDWWNIISSYAFLPSVNAEGKIEPLLGVGWTLTFEMFFYAVFALALLLRRNIYRFVGAVMVLCALGSLWVQPDWPAISFYLSPRVLEFYFGMLLALWSAHRRLPRGVAIGCLIAGFVVLLAGSEFLPPLPLLIRKGIPAVLIVAAVISLEPWAGHRVPRSLIFLGGASYSIYLFHPMVAPIVPAVLNRIGADGTAVSVLSVLGAIVLSTAAACGLHMLVERPVTTYLNARLRRSERRRAEEAARV
jgi:exopolysaccharide production protein ExoZ